MNRPLLVFLLFLVLIGCTTTKPHIEDKKDNSPPHTAEDTTRSFASPFQAVVEACNLAIADVGADYLEPIIELNEGSATITAASETSLYGILLLGYDDRTDVMLFLEDKSAKEIIRKSVFDKFWEAMESHL